MNEILQSETPYSLIKESEGLIHTVEATNQQLIEARRKNAEARVKYRLEQIIGELDRATANADLRNRCLQPIQQLRKEVESQYSLAHLITVPERAQTLADEAISQIEDFEKQAKGTGIKDNDVKIRRVIKASDYSASTYLETQEQVDAYIQKLKDALTTAIDEGERIEIR